MSSWRLVVASLRHHWRTHVGVCLGSCLGAAVLVGALVVGDSVGASLRQRALERVGDVDHALLAGDRSFRVGLAGDVASSSGARTAAVLRLVGIASSDDGGARANEVRVLGVDSAFFGLGPGGGERAAPAPGEAHVNGRLAAQLGVAAGDRILLRVETPSAMPRDATLADTAETSLARRVTVSAVLGADDFADFGLEASPVPPFNALVDRDWLAEELGLEGRANLLLAALGDGARGDGTLGAALRSSWTLGDAELELADVEGRDQVAVTTPRVFLDEPVRRALATTPGPLVGVLTYFVNDITVGGETAPYAVVAGIGALAGEPDLGPLPSDLGDDDIVFNDWLAAKLGAVPGDEVELSYFALGSGARLLEESATLRLRAVVPMEGWAGDRALLPDFPGLAGTDSCRDWEPGIPIVLERLGDDDQAYWEEFQGTPKAFVSLATAERLWADRFGSLTAVRGPLSAKAAIEERLGDLEPASLGLSFRDVRSHALASAAATTDFGGLFLALSFFLIGAALLLTSLLFVFGVEERSREVGTLLAIGFPPRRVRRLFLAEAVAIAVVGAAPGAVLGVLYTKAVLAGLSGVWSDAVGSASIALAVRPATVAVGAAASVLAATAAIAVALRRSFRRHPTELLAGGGPAPAAEAGAPRKSLVVAGVSGAAFLAALVLVDPDAGPDAAGLFFGAGSALLVCGLALGRAWLARGGRAIDPSRASVPALGVRNVGRRPGRSLATAALLASGAFLVVAVGVNRRGTPTDTHLRASGTGGFQLIGRSTLPVFEDLETELGRDAYALSEADMEGVGIVPLRVRDGDDASCTNLAVSENPRLVAVRPELLASRGAFSFAAVEGEPPDSAWTLLAGDPEADVVPAIGDANSVRWSLHKSLGDTIEYVDERGRTFEVKIVATVASSILQGNLVIDERAFEERFPSVAGHRMFLIDAPVGTEGPDGSVDAPDAPGGSGVPTDRITKTLTRALEDVGLELQPTARKLAEFNAVQDTYIVIFQLLGGLGLLLGSVGLGVVVLRNALERRSELALLRAVGFPLRSIRWLVLCEHGVLLVLGLLCGGVAALGALVPTLAGAADFPLTASALVLLGVGANGLAWVVGATALALRGPLLAALRNE